MTTTTVSGIQQLLETLASTPLEDDVQQGEGKTFAAALIERRTIGWDPHDVWLHRIKEPRDHQSRDG